MSDTALSKDAMLISLRDIHLPAEAPGGLIAELAASVGLAAGAAIVVLLVLRVFSIRKAQAVPLVSDQVVQSDWSDDRKRIALLHQLRKQDPQRYAELTRELYQPVHRPELSQLEAEVGRHV